MRAQHAAPLRYNMTFFEPIKSFDAFALRPFVECEILLRADVSPRYGAVDGIAHGCRGDTQGCRHRSR